MLYLGNRRVARMSLEQDLLVAQQQAAEAILRQQTADLAYTVKRRRIEDAKIAKQLGLKLEDIIK